MVWFSVGGLRWLLMTEILVVWDCERRSVSYDASQTGTGLVSSEVGQLFVKTSLRWESERLMWALVEKPVSFPSGGSRPLSDHSVVPLAEGVGELNQTQPKSDSKTRLDSIWTIRTSNSF